jgi:hypothetical protein
LLFSEKSADSLNQRDSLRRSPEQQCVTAEARTCFSGRESGSTSADAGDKMARLEELLRRHVEELRLRSVRVRTGTG